MLFNLDYSRGEVAADVRRRTCSCGCPPQNHDKKQISMKINKRSADFMNNSGLKVK